MVVSDSQYVVLGANDPSRKRYANRRYWNALDKAMALHTYVEFVHVRGHANHFWNEMADQLAGEARMRGKLEG
jgi:ribonuclease HI